MKLVSWNVNGIRAVERKGLFTPFVQQIDADVICLQETKAQQTQATLELSGYREHWNSADKKGYSGTAIFTRREPLSVSRGLPANIIKRHKVLGDAFGDPNTEGRVLTVEFEELFVVTVYTPN